MRGQQLLELVGRQPRLGLGGEVLGDELDGLVDDVHRPRRHCVEAVRLTPDDDGGDHEHGDRGQAGEHPRDRLHCTRRAYEAAMGRPDRLPASDADALGEQLAVVGRVAEEQLGALGPLEVEVRRVLPREPDAAVDLDVLGGGVEVRLGAVGLGQ